MTCAYTRNTDTATALIAAARSELRAAGQSDDDSTVARYLAQHLAMALRGMSAGHVRMAPGEAVRAGKVRPVALGSEMEPVA